MKVIVDTDALIGLVDIGDALSARSNHVAHLLAEQRATIIILPTTLAEFALVATSKIGLAATKQTVEQIMRSYVGADITQDVVMQATDLYYQQTTKKNSLFDCFVMVGTKQSHADCIFSFDRGYKQNGFVLIEDFFAQRAGK